MNNAVPALEAPMPVRVNVRDGRIAPCPDDGETKGMWLSRVREALGIESDDLAQYILATLFKGSTSPEELKLNAMLAQVVEGHPRDVQEAVLLAMMAATNQRFQDALAAKVNSYDPEDALRKAKIAAMYGRLYDHQMETLRKYRRTGDQTITVIHAQNALVGVKS